MVWAGDLTKAALSLTFILPAAIARGEDATSAQALFPFDRSELAHQVTDLTYSKGIKASFYRNSCQDAEMGGRIYDTCDYGFAALRYRVWSDKISGKVAYITARTPQANRYLLSDTNIVGISLVIATVEGTRDDEVISPIVERLAAASRSMSGLTTVETARALYEMRVDRVGYAFSAASKPN